MTAGAPELVHAYIGAIGAAEPNYGNFLQSIGTNHPFYPSMMVGHGCLLLSQNPDSAKTVRRATGFFERADDAIETRLKVAESPTQEGPLSGLQHTVRTILSRDDSGTLSSLQDDLNKRTVDTISWLLWEIDENTAADEADSIGVLAQQLTIAAHTRRRGGCVLPFMALTHHDQGPSRPQNYDTLAVYKAADWMRARVTKLQVKAGCLALSPEHADRDIGQHNRLWKTKTAEDIVLISGCCDLGGTERSARAIVAEDNGEARGKVLRGLNTMSDHMTRIAKGSDTWDRRGVAEKKPAPLTQGYLRMMRRLASGQVVIQPGLATQ